MPPMPPSFYFNGSSTVETITDEAGNVIIKLQKDGKPIEIKVQDGAVFMDGKKLENGEPVVIPGMGFGSNMPFNFNLDHEFNYDALGENEMAFLFNYSNEDRARWEEQAEKMRAEGKNFSDEYRALMEQHHELSKEERKEMEKKLKAHRKEWEKGAKEWEKEQEKWQKEQEKWQAEQEKWHAENRNWNRGNSGGDFQKAMKAELLREKLIDSPTDYSFRLNSESLKINGKKQSDEIHRKYLDMYEKYSGNKMKDGDNYTIEEHD